MSVLKKLTKQERKNLNRCLVDRPQSFFISATFNNEKTIEPYFTTVCGEYRNHKRILSTLIYAVSREKIKNEKEFIVEISCYPSREYMGNINRDFEKYAFFDYEIKSNEIFNDDNLTFLKVLSNFFIPSFILFISFSEGNFEEDKPKNINKNKIFKSKECLICLENTPDVHFLDFGHQCVCDDCFSSVINMKTHGTICPMCKTENHIINKI